MRRFFLFAVYGLVAILLENTLLSNIPTALVKFDFIIIAVISIALSEDQHAAIPTVILLGFFIDATSSAPFGLAIFSLLLIYAFIRMIFAKIAVDLLIARFVWVAFASLMNKTIIIILSLIWSGHLSIAKIILRLMVPQALFDGTVGLLMIPAIMWYDSLTWEKISRPKGLVLK